MKIKKNGARALAAVGLAAIGAGVVAPAAMAGTSVQRGSFDSQNSSSTTSNFSLRNGINHNVSIDLGTQRKDTVVRVYVDQSVNGKWTTITHMDVHTNHGMATWHYGTRGANNGSSSVVHYRFATMVGGIAGAFDGFYSHNHDRNIGYYISTTN